MGKKQTTGDNQTTPLERSYWVVPGKLLAGCYPGDEDNNTARTKLDHLMTAGIRHFIDLMTPDEVGRNNKPLEPYVYLAANIAMKRGIEATFDRFGIKDTWVPTRKEMGLILDRIDDCMEKDRAVYLHCWGGRGRTGTVVGCYLIRHGYTQSREVIEYIRELRSNTKDGHLASPETSQQIDMVLSWVEGE